MPASAPIGPLVPVVIVVTWRGRRHIRRCIESLTAQTARCTVLVVDNASDDGTATILDQLVAAHPGRLRVERTNRNLGFAGGVDFALSLLSEASEPEFVALLNDDAAAEPTWLAALQDAMAADGGIAAVTSRVVLPDGVLNNAGVGLRLDGYGYDLGLGQSPADFDDPRDVFGFCGAAALIRLGALRAVGGFPPEFFLYYEDTDTSWRLRLDGWAIRFEPLAVALHEHSASSDQRSRSFAYHNERNRLWMLVRCAPMHVAARQLARFSVTTASIAARRVMSRTAQPHNLTVGLRVQVLAHVLRSVPKLVRQRRAEPADRQQRAAVWREWAGRPPGP